MDKDEEEGRDRFGIIALELQPVEAAVERLQTCKVTCEDVLSGLVRWADTAKAAEFLRCWEHSHPMFGCDMELMMEAVQRIEIHGTSLVPLAGTIIGSVFDDTDLNMFIGDWDERMADKDREAFRKAYLLASASRST